MATKFRVIKPKRVSRTFFRSEMGRISENTRTNLLRNFRRTTKTWVYRVRFANSIQRKNYQYVIDVYANSTLYYTINWGTPFITDVLSRNFIPKTRPFVLDSFPGRGGRVRRGGPARPGIIPRRWDLAAAREEEPLMISRLQNVIDRFVIQSGHQLP